MPALWFGLVCLILIGAAIANRTFVPNAVLWALLGLGFAFIPGVPTFRLNPQFVLYLVLPPLVYASAVELPWPDFRDNLRSISLLAIGLVAATTVLVAWIAHAVIGLPWAVGFVLGAVVSPTDPVAASAVASRVGLPERLVAILEGEGLVNDAVALSIVRIGLVAAVGQAFSFSSGFLHFLAIILGETLYGWLLGIGVAFLRRRISDPLIEITVSLLTPFAAYLLPEYLGGSGILATVAVGMYIGEQNYTLVPAGTRLHATSFWQMIVFILNGGLFVAAGIELRRIFGGGRPAVHILGWGLLVAAAVAIARVLWCAVSWYGSRALRAAVRRRRGSYTRGAILPARGVAILAWSGMRGPISLAAALSIPAAASGHFPDFEIVLFIASVVIVVTLVGQGALLPILVRSVGLSQDTAAYEQGVPQQMKEGRMEAARAALDRLGELERERRVDSRTAAKVRERYQERLDEAQTEEDANAAVSVNGGIWAQLIGAERTRILQLRNSGRIGDHALERLQRGLDQREVMLD